MVGKPQLLQDIDELNRKVDILLKFIGKIVEHNSSLSDDLKKEYNNIKSEFKEKE